MRIGRGSDDGTDNREVIRSLQDAKSEDEIRQALRSAVRLAEGLVSAGRSRDAVELLDRSLVIADQWTSAVVRAQSSTLLVSKARALADIEDVEMALHCLDDAIIATRGHDPANERGLSGHILIMRLQILLAAKRSSEALIVARSLNQLAVEAAKGRLTSRIRYALAGAFFELQALVSLGQYDGIASLPGKLWAALDSFATAQERPARVIDEVSEEKFLDLVGSFDLGGGSLPTSDVALRRATRDVLAESALELFAATERWRIPGVNHESSQLRSAVSALEVVADKLALETGSWSPSERSAVLLLNTTMSDLIARMPTGRGMMPAKRDRPGFGHRKLLSLDSQAYNDALREGVLLSGFEVEFVRVLSCFTGAGEALRHRLWRYIAPTRIALGSSLLAAADPGEATAELGIAYLTLASARALFVAAWGPPVDDAGVALDASLLRGFACEIGIRDWIEQSKLPVPPWLQ